MHGSPILDELRWRGLLHQHSEGLGDALARQPVSVYAGFDPTASSMHVGSLIPVMGLMHLQLHGHKPFAVVGGGTGLIGDPSGRESEHRHVRRLSASGRGHVVRKPRSSAVTRQPTRSSPGRRSGASAPAVAHHVEAFAP